MKVKTLAAILSTMLNQGADVSFYSSYYRGFCSLQNICGVLFITYVYDPENQIAPNGGCYVINNLPGWVAVNKKDVKNFILAGGAF
ncbi:hypothetical protein [Methanosarcina barkeri]|uniref:hypothetical protein n=1 Tax=Methanosarcina barkeri TaxID=2208 RepID=UPI00003C6833|nr:hypothetical protein [Methanosarcina barkeri]